ncbi:MAG: immunoglobulin domain-containing protein, partial [Verrucomicrobiales bacterium]|nr:immunoglobulin domain-containing protein [Verrucomicrobiales bacterium]
MGSSVKLPVLVTVRDVFGQTTSGAALYSGLFATWSGRIESPKLATVQGTSLEWDATGEIGIAEITTLASSRVVARGGTRTFAKLFSATDSHLSVTGGRFEAPLLDRFRYGTLQIRGGGSVSLPALQSITGSSLYLSGGVVLALPKVLEFRHDSTASSQSRVWRVEGVGTRLELVSVASVTGGTSYDSRFEVQAFGGGTIDLSGLRSVSDPSDGDNRWRALNFVARDAGSRLKLGQLTSMVDQLGTTTSGDGLFSLWQSRWGGEIDAPKLATLRGVHLDLDGSGLFPVAQIENVTGSRLTLGGHEWNFAALREARGSEWNVAGVTVAAPTLTALERGTVTLGYGGSFQAGALVRVDGTSFYLRGGSVAILPGVTQYRHLSNASSQHRVWRVEDVGSRLELPGVTEIRNGTHYDSRLIIQAWSGGRVSLDDLQTIVDPTDGDTRYRAIDISAHGMLSVVELGSLETATDVLGSASSGDGLYSRLAEAAGGTLVIPSLRTLQGVWLDLEGIDDTRQIGVARIVSGRLSLSGRDWTFASLVDLSYTELEVDRGTVSMPAVTTANGASFFVRLGAEVSLPAVIQYAHASTGSSQRRTWRVEGAGSRLELANLERIENGSHYDSRLVLQALGGGLIRAERVAGLVENATGDTRYRAITVTAEDEGSRVSLPSLVAVLDVYGGSLSGDGLYSQLTTRAGGTLDLPELARLEGVYLRLEGQGSISTAKLARLAGSLISVRGPSIELPLLTQALGSSFEVYGGELDLPNLTEWGSGNWDASGGGVLSLPGVIGFGVPGTSGVSTTDTLRTIRAHGIGSRIELPSLAVLYGGQAYGSRTTIQASGGGVVRANALTRIEDPTTGDARQRAIHVVAQGIGSRIEAKSLESVVDRQGTSTSGDALYSRVTATYGGTLNLGEVASRLTGALAELRKGGSITGNLVVETGSVLEGNGTLTGDLTNRGSVRPEGLLKVGGQWTQVERGRLEIEISGGTSGTQYDVLEIGGSARLDGTLAVALRNGFVPPVDGRFEVLRFDALQASFSAITGLQIAADRYLLPAWDSDALELVTTAVVTAEPPTIAVSPISRRVFQGQSVTFRVDAVGSGSLTYQWQHDGEDLQGRTSNVLVLTSAQGPDAGAYRVRVTNAAGSTWSSEAVLEVEVSSGYTIAVGDTVSPDHPAAGAGTIEVAGGQDLYVVSVRAGQRVFFDNLAAAAGLSWSLRDALGNERFGTGLDGASSDPGTILFDVDGTAVVTVYGRGTATGDYRFRLVEVQDRTFDIAVGDEVAPGKPSDGAGGIDLPGSADIFRFAVAAGQSVFFDKLSNGAGLSWRLRDVSGAERFVVRLDAGNADPATVTFAEAGTATVTVFGRDDAVGEYRFKLWNVADQRFDLTVGSEVRETDPPDGRGRIETPGGRDVYSIAVEAGQTVFFDRLSDAPGLSWSLRDASGTTRFQANLDAGSADPGNIAFAQAGVATLTVFGQADAVGTYAFAIRTLADQAFDIAVGAEVRETDPPDGRGRIETAGARDIYSIAVTAGQTVFFDKLENSSGLSWTLYDAAGVERFSTRFDAGFADPGSVTFAEAGVVTLTVFGRGDAVGAYAFKTWNVTDQVFTTSVGAEVREPSPADGRGRIETPGIRDVYSLTV